MFTVSKKYTSEELSKLPFMDSSQPLEKRVNDLLERLSLKEKSVNKILKIS